MFPLKRSSMNVFFSIFICWKWFHFLHPRQSALDRSQLHSFFVLAFCWNPIFYGSYREMLEIVFQLFGNVSETSCNISKGAKQIAHANKFYYSLVILKCILCWYIENNHHPGYWNENGANVLRISSRYIEHPKWYVYVWFARQFGASCEHSWWKMVFVYMVADVPYGTWTASKENRKEIKRRKALGMNRKIWKYPVFHGWGSGAIPIRKWQFEVMLIDLLKWVFWMVLCFGNGVNVTMQ